MPFSHDVEHALACVVDLVNSVTDGGLNDLEDLRAFVARQEISEVSELTARDLAATRELAGRIRQVFDCETDAEAARTVNALIAGSSVTPRLTDHDGYQLHLHYFSPGAALAEHLAVDCGIALAQVIAAGERERLRRCDAPDCDSVLVDLSRNRSKRYCDARTCGNRLHVAAYRERRRAAEA